MVRKGSQLSPTDRESTPSWKLLYGSGTDPNTTTVGIIGKMREATAGFTGISATSMNSEDVLMAPSDLPAVDVFVRATKSRSRKVHRNPPLIIKYTVTWSFYVQAENLIYAHFDLDYYQQKTCELIQNANNSSNATFYDFGVPSFLYFIDDSNISRGPLEKFRLAGGGKGASGNVVCEISVRTVQ